MRTPPDADAVSSEVLPEAAASSNTLAARLVTNLKALNAKERDHLMRLAYLGADECYESSRRWLSPAMEEKLQAFAAPGARCVFAAMDYHLDWIYAALLGACGDRQLEGLGEALIVDDTCEDASLQAVIGIQEDVDLIAVFTHSTLVWLILVEAKGDAGFGSKQLARKLIRLDRILVRSGALGRIEARLVLVAPSARDASQGSRRAAHHERNLLSHASKAATLADHLKTHESGIGTAVEFVSLTNFPRALKRVTRVRDEHSTAFARWIVEDR